MTEYIWYKQTKAPDFKVIDCPDYDEIKNFHRDPTGCYVLVRCDRGLIEVAVCDKNHQIMKAFRGRKAQDLYYTIFQYEKRNKLKWFSRNDHAAYLGKELKKCEYALKGKEEYIQE